MNAHRKLLKLNRALAGLLLFDLLGCQTKQDALHEDKAPTMPKTQATPPREVSHSPAWTQETPRASAQMSMTPHTNGPEVTSAALQSAQNNQTKTRPVSKAQVIAEASQLQNAAGTSHTQLNSEQLNQISRTAQVLQELALSKTDELDSKQQAEVEAAARSIQQQVQQLSSTMDPSAATQLRTQLEGQIKQLQDTLARPKSTQKYKQ